MERNRKLQIQGQQMFTSSKGKWTCANKCVLSGSCVACCKFGYGQNCKVTNSTSTIATLDLWICYLRR